MKRLLGVILALLLFIQPAFPAPLNIAGFEEGDLSDCRSTTGTTAYSSTSKRTGAGSLRVSTTSTGNCRMSQHATTGNNTTDMNDASLWVRWYMCVATLPATEEEIYKPLDTGASDKAIFTINSAGHIKSYNQAGTFQATGSYTFTNSDCTNAANFILVEISTTTSASASAYEVKVNGSSDISGSMTQLSSNHGSVRFGRATSMNGNTTDIFYDDIQLNNSAYPGAGQISKMVVDSNGSTESWIAGDAACTATNSNCYLEVDEIPTDGDTTYVQNATSGAALFGFESSSSAGISGTISAVKGRTNFKENVDGSATTVVRIRSGSTNSDSANNNVGTSYVNRWRLLTVDPADSAAWTTGDLDAIEVGVNEGTALQVNRLSSVGIQVDYAPSAATATPTPTNTPTPTPTPTNTPTPTPTPVPVTLRLLSSLGVGQ